MHVALDTETTGLGPFGNPPRPDGVLEVGVAWRDPYTRDFTTWSSLVRPRAELVANDYAKYALNINGLKLEELEVAPQSGVVAARLARLLGALQAQSPTPLVLVAHNAAFDKHMMAETDENLATAVEGFEWKCTQVRGRPVAKVSGWLSLKKGLEIFKVVPPWKDGEMAAHRASGDALAALMLWEKLDELGAPL